MELKRPVSYNELVYIKVHKKKDGDYVSNRAKEFVESYEHAMSEKYGKDSSTHPAVDYEIWLQAAGKNKKGRVHGIGRNLDIDILGSTHASSSEVVDPSTHPTPMTNEDVTTTINVALTFFMETQMSQMQAQIQFFRTEILPVLKTQKQPPVQQPGEN
ncbi:putative transposase, Ptta/En/Spm, plant [Sesbania bispinosa]|nr:putative transposase, Ptta/En/Spm, plant [Sesbania bispinosa]